MRGAERVRASVCIFSAAHGRFGVSQLVFRQRKLLADELRGAGVAAISLVAADDDNLDIARGLGHETLEHPNFPLGAKCSAGLVLAAGLADYVVWAGSDDLIHPDAFLPLVREQANDTPTVYVGARFCLVDVARGKLTRAKGHSVWGAVPWLVDSRLLQGAHGPIQWDLDRGLDGALVRGIRRSRVPFRFETDDPHEFRCVDLKTDENLHAYARLQRGLALAPEEDAWPALADYFPASVVDGARQLSEELRPGGQ